MPLVEEIHYLKTDSEEKQEGRALNAWMWDTVGGIRQDDTKNVEEEENEKEDMRCREQKKTGILI